MWLQLRFAGLLVWRSWLPFFAFALDELPNREDRENFAASLVLELGLSFSFMTSDDLFRALLLEFEFELAMAMELAMEFGLE